MSVIIEQGIPGPVEHPTLVVNPSRSAAGTARPQAALGSDALVSDASESEPTTPRVPGYEILSVLGTGGMGVVYKALQRSLDRPVALKMIRPEIENDPELLARFRTEAAAIARLHHPSIVQVYEVGSYEGRPYLCLEFIEGTTLEEWIGGKPHEPRTAARLTEQLALALDHAHQHGIIHRDMKPANVLLDRDESPHVTDFGIARVLQGDAQGLTRNNELLGTPAYMAPEQTRKGTIEATTDVYALGVILYEMLTGRPPFVAPTGFETIQLVQTVEPVAPRRLQPGISRDLETITMKCLRKDPAQRYHSALALAEDLRRWLDNQPIHARPVSTLRRVSGWCRRNPGTAALTVCLLLAIGTLVGLMGVWRNSAEVQRIAEARRFERLQGERERLEQALTEDLARIEASLQAEDVAEARVALLHAQGLLGVRSDWPEIAARLAEYERDIHLVLSLEQVRSRLGQARGGFFDARGRSDEIQALMAPRGIRLGTPHHNDWIEPLRRSVIRWKLIRSLDLWAYLRVQVGDVPGCEWILELNNRLDDDSWCAEARRELLARDAAGLVRRGQKAQTEKHSRERWRLLATLLRLVQQNEEAKQVYRTALLAYPNDFLLANGLGILLMEENHPDSWREALGCFRAALAIRPASAGVQLNAGVLFGKLNQPHEALAAYRRAAEIQPDYAMAYYNQGRMLAFLNRLSEAVDAYQRSIELEPDNPAAYYHLAVLHARRGQIDRFHAELDRIDHKGFYRYEMAAELVHDLDRANLGEVALDFRRRWLKLEPQRPELHYSYGTALMEQFRHSEAVLALRKAIELRPEHPESWCNLGLSLIQVGRFDEAVEKLCHGHQMGLKQSRWNYPSDRWLAEAHRFVLLAQQFETTPAPELLQSLDAAGLAQLGRLASIRQEFRLATQAFLRALQRERQEGATPVNSDVPWFAARAALRAGLGQGTNPPAPEQLPLYRTQAVQLIQSHLNLVDHWLDQRRPQNARFLAAHLENCLTLDALVDFRRSTRTNELPEEERAAWKQLFERTEALRDRARRQAVELAQQQPSQTETR